MRERFASGYNDFVLPFLIGMAFVITYCLVALMRILLQLSPEDRKRFFISLVTPKTMLKNVRDIFCDCLLHVKIWKRNKLLGYMHSSIAFGWFMLLFFLMDFFLLVVLSGIALAIIKRIRSRLFGMRRTTRPSLLDMIGLYSLWAIFPLRLLAEGFTADISGGSFLTKSLNHLFTAFLSDHANILPSWWAYSCALGIFFVVLPFTRYMHIPSEILLIPMRNAGLKIRNARKGLAKAQVYSCPGCGLCIDACPMSVQKANTKDTTVYLNRQIRRGNERRIEEISDKCLLCGKCTAVCPVGVEGDRLRIAQRSVRRYGISPDYSSIDTAPLTVDSRGKVLYYAGCMTALTPSIRKSMESLLRKAGVDYELMDRDGGICCGRPMWMAGRIKEAMQMMLKNTEIIRSSGAGTLLLSCPICYRIFREKYKLDGIRIVHHTEFIDGLISQGRLDVADEGRRFVYHDPCELGRGCGIYEQPRSVLSRIGTLVEAEKNRKESICCGGSVGSLSLGFDKRRVMTENALANLTVASPDVIVTACPLCLGTFGRYADRKVEDIAETVDRNASPGRDAAVGR